MNIKQEWIATPDNGTFSIPLLKEALVGLHTNHSDSDSIGDHQEQSC